MPSVNVRVDAYRTLGFAALTTNYQELGTSFAHPMKLICLTNNTQGDLAFSFDGTTNNFVVIAGGFKLLDLTTNRDDNLPNFVFQTGTQVFVKYLTAPVSGGVYLEAIYAQGT